MRTAITVLCVCLLSLAAHAQGPAYPYHVGVTWTLSIDPPAKISGYNVYRMVQTGTTCGGSPVKLNATLLSNSTTSFDDATVADVTTYCYTGTSVDINNRESAFSNIDQDNGIPAAPPTGFGATVAKNGTQENVVATWIQSKDRGLIANDLYAGKRSGGPYTKHVHLQPPATQATIKNVAKGTYFAVVTATAKAFGESGGSNEVKIFVP